MSKEQIIPNFLFEFIRISAETGVVTSPFDITHMFYFDKDPAKANNHLFQADFFKKAHLIAKNTLDLSYKGTNLFTSWGVSKVFETESAFMEMSVNNKETLNIPTLYDIPVYWYNNETKELGKSILPGAFEMVFLTFPETTIFVHYEFSFFSNHIRRLPPYNDYSPEFYYFEPAAKLNRELMRTFTSTMAKNYPSLIIEFATDRCSVHPRDDFGFLDGADFKFNK